MTRVWYSFIALLFAVGPALASERPAVCVEPLDLRGPRLLQEETARSVTRDYLEAWQQMATAMNENRSDLLKNYFVGTAGARLERTITEQRNAGIHTRYEDLSHNLQFLFYSPDGLSIEMLDAVTYKMQILNGDKTVDERTFHTRYLSLLTPSELRWRVRIFQAQSSNQSTLQRSSVQQGSPCASAGPEVEQ